MLLLRCGCTGIKKSDLRRFKCLHNGKKKIKTNHNNNNSKMLFNLALANHNYGSFKSTDIRDVKELSS